MDNKRVYRNKCEEVVTSIERAKIIRHRKRLQAGVQKRRDKNLLQNWAGSHARKAGLVASPSFGGGASHPLRSRDWC
jgi:3-methyladenine DNA glycosylase Tag